MSIMNIGSLGNYMKNMKLQTQWQLRKQSGDFTSHKKSLEEWLKDSSSFSLSGTKETANSCNIDKDALYNKIQSGKKLTAAEKDYLRKNDPLMYEKVKSIERERKAYEEEIKHCKTKEEVQRVKTAHVNASLSVVKSVQNNPNISDSQKLAYAMVEQAKIKAIAEVTAKFVKSGEYANLPTDAEYAEAMKEIEEPPAKEEKEPENADDSDNTEESIGEENITKETLSEKISDTDVKIESEEVQKARRAKAKAAYRQFDGEWDSANAAGNFTVSFDTKG